MSKLREFRKSKGMTQADLAKKVGVKKPTISKIERGVSTPSVGLIRRILALSDGELTAVDLVTLERAA